MRRSIIWYNFLTLKGIASAETVRAEAELWAEEIGISRNEFIGAMSLVALFFFHESREDVPDLVGIEQLIAELKNLGIKDTAEKARLLIKEIEFSFEDSKNARQKGLFLRSILPTLEDIDIICDLRAVFSELPSFETSKNHKENVKIFLGFKPVVLVSFVLNDSAGNDTSHNFQLTERGLRRLTQTLQEALDQLEVTKKNQEMLP